MDLHVTRSWSDGLGSATSVLFLRSKAMHSKSEIKMRNRALTEQDTILFYRKKVFSLTFIAYAMSHFLRKSYTTCKVELVEMGLNSLALSVMDTLFMLCYAIGSIGSGRLGDTCHAPTIIGLGLIGSACCMCLLVTGLLAKDMRGGQQSLWNYFFFVAWAAHGFFQSAGGPVGTAIMGNWFTMKNRGWIFGVWTAHQYVGNVAAALLTSLVLSISLSWIYALLLPAVFCFCWGVFVARQLPERPQDVHLETEESAAKALAEQLSGSGGEGVSTTGTDADSAPLPPISFTAAMRIPNVLSYALAFGFLKLINYALFFWLPFFLSQHFSPSQSNLISTLYDVGMMPGGAILGSLSDCAGGRRACVIMAFMFLLIPTLWVIEQHAMHLSAASLLALLGVTGILVGGPNSIITSVVAVDLAQHPSIRGDGQALGTVTGIISGTGSMTAALGLCAIGPLQSRLGWAAVWYFLIGCTLAGMALILPKMRKELHPHSTHGFDVAIGAAESVGVPGNNILGPAGTSRNISSKCYRYGSI